MKITVVGTGYVGLSNSLLLAQNNKIVALDIDKNRIELLQNKTSPIQDEEIEEFLQMDLDISFTTDKEFAYKNSDFVVIATPTDYNIETNYFDSALFKETEAMKLISSTNIYSSDMNCILHNRCNII